VAASPLPVLRRFLRRLKRAQGDLIQRIDRGAQMAARQMQVDGGVFKD